SAVLLSKRLFLLPAFGGVFYNIFIILGGVALGSRLGIESLAWGALAGGIVGPFLLNAMGAARAGMSYRPSFATPDAGFRQWWRRFRCWPARGWRRRRCRRWTWCIAGDDLILPTRSRRPSSSFGLRCRWRYGRRRDYTPALSTLPATR